MKNKNTESLQDNPLRYEWTESRPIESIGWVCPVCQNVWGPMVKECDRCNNPTKGVGE